MINTVPGLPPKKDKKGRIQVDVNGSYVVAPHSATGVSTQTTFGIVGYIIEDSGYDYLPAPDGSKGGDGRTWAEVVDTTVRREDGTYEVPIPPNNNICVKAGEEVNLPPGTTVITEPFNGKGGGETILGGGTHICKFDGCFTAPLPTYEQVAGYYPTLDNGAYPVINYLCDVEILSQGFGYKEDDIVVLDPDYGAKCSIRVDNFGRIIEVVIDEEGEAFFTLPEVYVVSDTGYQAELNPVLCVDRISRDDMSEPGMQDKVISVVDCVGNVPSGYLDGDPYFGPTHIHNGVRMVGGRHTDQAHRTIKDLP